MSFEAHAAVLLASLAWLAIGCTGIDDGAAARPGSASSATSAGAAAAAAATAAAGATLDTLHAAAARADGPAYFALFTSDAVFIGTDASERWDLPAFRAYAGPYFSKGQGWTYVPTERHLVLGPSGDVAWFDERLQNETYGETRGSGALVLRDGRWLIAQYVLSMPVPNELAADLVQRVRALPAPATSLPSPAAPAPDAR